MKQRTIVATTVALLSVLILGFAFVRFAHASTVTPIYGGGTGTSTPPTYGKVLIGDSNGNYELTATSSLNISAAAAGSSGQVQYNAGGSLAGVATSSASCSGFISCASGDNVLGGSSLTITTTGQLSVANGGTGSSGPGGNLFLYTNSGGTAFAGVASSSLDLPNAALQNNSVTITPISYELSGGGTVALGATITLNASTSPTVGYIDATSTTIANQLPYASSTMSSFTTASTTNLTVSSIRSALIVTSADGAASAYGGASACSSNNFVTTISALGATTCGTATISGINLGSNLDSLSNDGATLNGSSFNGSATVSNWAINLNHSNWWTALENFTNASTSQLTATSSVWLTGLTAGTGNGAVCATSAGLIEYSSGANCVAGGGGGISDPFTHPAAGQSATTSLMLLYGNASTTGVSASTAFFGATATTTITSGGFVGIATTSPYAPLSVVGNGGVVADHYTGTSTVNASTFVDATTTNATISTALYIPQTSSSTLPTAGQIAVQTGAASSSIQYQDGTVQEGLYDITGVGLTFTNYPTFGTGTSTTAIMNASRGVHLVDGACTSSGGTAEVGIGNGTATTSYIAATVATHQAPTTFSSNSTFIPFAPIFVAIGNFSSSGTTTVQCGFDLKNIY